MLYSEKHYIIYLNCCQKLTTSILQQNTVFHQIIPFVFWFLMFAHTQRQTKGTKGLKAPPSTIHICFFSISTKQPELGVPLVPLHSFTQIYYNADSLEILGGHKSV